MPILLFQMLVKMNYEQRQATKLYVFFILECPLNEIYFVPNRPPQLNLIVKYLVLRDVLLQVLFIFTFKFNTRP